MPISPCDLELTHVELLESHADRLREIDQLNEARRIEVQASAQMRNEIRCILNNDHIDQGSLKTEIFDCLSEYTEASSARELERRNNSTNKRNM